MSIEIYVDGKFFPKEEAKVSVFDHGLLYGDGVFEEPEPITVGFLSLTNISTGSMIPPRQST